MNRVIVSDIINLPTEITLLIVAIFTKDESTVCARVSKAWYGLFIDQIWHTVHIGYPDPDPQSNNDQFTECFGEPKDGKPAVVVGSHGPATVKEEQKSEQEIATTTTVTGPPLLGRHLHRIKVLRLDYFSLFDIFYRAIQENDAYMDRQGHGEAQADQDLPLDLTTATVKATSATMATSATTVAAVSRTRTKLYFEEVDVNLCNDPGNDTLLSRTPEQLAALQDVLQRVTGTLTRFTATLQTRFWTPGDQAHLLAALPRSLEQLSLRCFGNRSRSPRLEIAEMEKLAIQDQIARIPVATETFEKLQSLSMAGLNIDLEVLMALLRRCPALQELNVSNFSGNESRKLAQILSKGACCSYMYCGSSSNDPGFVKKGGGGGWKRLRFGSGASSGYDDLVVDAILDNRETLESLQIDVKSEFSASAIHRLRTWIVWSP